MTAPPVATYRDAILKLLGNDESAQVWIDAFWAIQAARTSDTYLCFLRTINALIDALIGNLPKQNLSLEGDDPRGTGARSQRDARRIELIAIRQNISGELALVGDATASLPATGVMTRTAPVPSPTGWPDANATFYPGDPNWLAWVTRFAP